MPTVRHARLGSAALLALCTALSAHAFQFSKGDLKGSFDTTISIGALYRLSDPDADLYGVPENFHGTPGTQDSANADDGNLNFPRGIASTIGKVGHDLEVKYKSVGAMARGYYFYDYHVQRNWKGRTLLSDEAVDRVGQGAEWADLYAYANTDLAGRPFSLRVGRQVLSLGESTFIPNGLNVVNPVDLSKLRVPGAELKEALLPVAMVKASYSITDNLTIEPFWLMESRINEIEPAGTYFSTNDFASRGGSRVMLGMGAIGDSSSLGAISREADRRHKNLDQGGITARLQVPSLNDTEFGFYFVRYNSRSPVISARTPTTGVNPNLTVPLTQAILSKAGANPSSAVIAAAQAQASAIFTALATPAASRTPQQLAMLASTDVQTAIAGAKKIAFLTAAGTGRYFVEYPEAINMVGVSFNTNLAKTGISWQGEVAYKNGVPLQIDDVELLFAAMSSLDATAGTPYGNYNQLGNYSGKLNTEVQGYRRHDVWTAQTSMTKVFGPTFGASQIALVGEIGGLWTDLPSKDALRYDGPGSFTSGNPAAMLYTGNAQGVGAPSYNATPYSAFADDFSWGYQLIAKADYNNLFAGVNVSPSLGFTHDVSGTSPLPLGNFIAGRRSVTVGMEFNYLNRWTLDLRYVNFFGARPYNLMLDRDYVSATVKYSF